MKPGGALRFISEAPPFLSVPCCLATFPYSVVTCDRPMINDGSINLTANSTVYRSQAIFKCNPGFELSGPSTLTCTHTGNWSDSYPICKRVSCPYLDVPTDGQRNGTGNLYEDNVSFTCNIGFKVGGSKTRTCLANGTWSGTNTTCQGNCSLSF